MDITARDAGERAHLTHSTIVENRYYKGPNIMQLTRFDGATMHLSSERHDGDRVAVAWNTQAYDGRPEDMGTLDISAADTAELDQKIAEWAEETTPQEIF